METADVKGLVILTGMVFMYSFILLGCLEQRLRRVGRVVKQMEEDAKYVN